MDMLLEHKNAVIYGAGGAIGGAVARAFSREGARVFLAGRTLAPIDATAREIAAAGGAAEAAQVDALDQQAVERHLDAVAEKAGAVDISFNAVGFEELQGVPLIELALEDFLYPITAWSRTVFLTGRAAARRMVRQGSGVILTINAPSDEAVPLAGGFGAACATVEALSRNLAAEVGPRGVRVVCLQPNAVPESAALRESVAQHARGIGVTPEEMLASLASETLLRRLPTLAEVADVAAFMASDRASAMTGTVIKINCGALVD
jgi:3-oxoacyl-[acyl-carrier protein] reductase